MVKKEERNVYLLSVCVSSIGPSALYIASHLMLFQILARMDYCYSHFVDEETEVTEFIYGYVIQN